MHTFTWDFDRVLLYLPFVDLPIYWYGFLFALGVLIAQKIFEKNAFLSLGIEPKKSQNAVLSFIIFIVIGARVFDLLFYQDLKNYLSAPLDLLNLRQGGLSSHGGFLGFLGALIYFAKNNKLSVYKLLNTLIAPAGILACFIRIGNMFNQEILGKAYRGPFSILFTAPLDGSKVIPRYPVQAIEALIYFLTFLLFRKNKQDPFKNVQIALLIFFGSRFFLEFIKEEQSALLGTSFLTMGQILSIPIVIFAIFNLCSRQYKKFQSKHP
jgi:prolipoprotein diacylglyceryl transferase